MSGEHINWIKFTDEERCKLEDNKQYLITFNSIFGKRNVKHCIYVEDRRGDFFSGPFGIKIKLNKVLFYVPVGPCKLDI